MAGPHTWAILGALRRWPRTVASAPPSFVPSALGYLRRVRDKAKPALIKAVALIVLAVVAWVVLKVLVQAAIAVAWVVAAVIAVVAVVWALATLRS